jgi:queuosine precursor transporter
MRWRTVTSLRESGGDSPPARFSFARALGSTLAMDTNPPAAPAATPFAAPTPAGVSMPLGMFVYTLLYGGMTVLAGVLAFKQVQLWPTSLAVESGIFPFLLLVVISSTLAQLYGRDAAKRIVWWGFLPLGLSALLLPLVLILPASSEMVAFRPDDLAAFERVHWTTPRVWMAGPASYITSLLLNIWIFDRLRGKGEGESTLGLMVRGAIASALSQAVDSVIFITLAFYGEFDITDLMIGQVLAKVFLSVVLVPFLITFGVRAAHWLDAKKAS